MSGDNESLSFAQLAGMAKATGFFLILLGLWLGISWRTGYPIIWRPVVAYEVVFGAAMFIGGIIVWLLGRMILTYSIEIADKKSQEEE